MSHGRDAYFPVAWQAAAGKPDRGHPARSDDPSMSDEVLIDAVARGDELALTEIISRYERRLSEFVRWSLDGAADMTEDVLQEVFLQVHRSAIRFAGQSTFKTWLYGLARNVCRHESRKLQRQPAWRAESDERLRDVASDARDPLETMTRDEARQLVRKAVDTLPPAYRVVLLLRDWEELSYSEIAEVLELPIGTVRSRLHNARALLAEQLIESLE